jgi:hypothetical protein
MRDIDPIIARWGFVVFCVLVVALVGFLLWALFWH